jgi:hypothetical protein
MLLLQAQILFLAQPCTDVISYVGASCKRMLALHVAESLMSLDWDGISEEEKEEQTTLYLTDKFMKDKQPVSKVRNCQGRHDSCP